MEDWKDMRRLDNRKPSEVIFEVIFQDSFQVTSQWCCSNGSHCPSILHNHALCEASAW